MANEKAKKARVPTAMKRKIQGDKKRMLNKAFRSKVSSAIRACREATESGAIKTALSLVYSLMDKGVKKGVFNKSKANRFKARITKKAAVKA